MTVGRGLLAAVIMALCAGGIAGSFLLDAPVREAVVKAQGKKWKKGPEARFHGVVRKYGDWPFLMLAGALGFGVAWRLGNRRWMRIVAAAMLASTAAGAIANVSRLTTGRTRPRSSPEVAQGFYGPWHEGRLLIGDSKYNAFPSGHAATAFGFAWPILFGCPPAGVLALALAALVAWSSLAIGAHHPSDLMVSFLLSFLVALGVWRFLIARGDLLAARFSSLAGRRKT